MNDIILNSYGEYKAALDKQMKESAEGFVRIGYLLKLAKDTDILKESGYANVNDFAKAEYGIDRTMVSRFISINDRFSENGNSPVLESRYQGFGYAKLAIMLQLPDELNEELTPDFSKREIQALKDELDEEKKVSDIEVLIESNTIPSTNRTELEEMIYKLCEDNVDVFKRLYAMTVPLKSLDGSNVVESYAPAGDSIYSVRVPGRGRYAISFKAGEPVTAINLRSSEKITYTPAEVAAATTNILWYVPFPDANAVKAWEHIYARPYPQEEKEEIAPVQQKKESKVKTAPPKEPQSRTATGTKPLSPPAKPKTEPQEEPKTAQSQINTGTTAIEENVENSVEKEPQSQTATGTDDISTVQTSTGSSERGYKAAIHSVINRMERTYANEQWQQLIEMAEDIIWRCKQILKIEDMEDEEDD